MPALPGETESIDQIAGDQEEGGTVRAGARVRQRSEEIPKVRAGISEVVTL
jgi:hypothetical protein